MIKIFSLLFIGLLFFNVQLFASWKVTTSKDEMSGEVSAYAISSYKGATKSMGFPYYNTKSFIGVGCTKYSVWAYIGFTHPLNLNDTKIEDGYNVIDTRIKFDENIEYVTYTQDFGSNFAHFLYPKEIIKKLKQSNKLLLEFNWYGNGTTYFSHSLLGSTSAINKAFKKCGYKEQ